MSGEGDAGAGGDGGTGGFFSGGLFAQNTLPDVTVTARDNPLLTPQPDSEFPTFNVPPALQGDLPGAGSVDPFTGNPTNPGAGEGTGQPGALGDPTGGAVTGGGGFRTFTGGGGTQQASTALAPTVIGLIDSTVLPSAAVTIGSSEKSNI